MEPAAMMMMTNNSASGNSNNNTKLDGICRRLWSSKCEEQCQLSSSQSECKERSPIEEEQKKAQQRYSKFTIENLLKAEKNEAKTEPFASSSTAAEQQFIFKCPSIFPISSLLLNIEWETGGGDSANQKSEESPFRNGQTKCKRPVTTNSSKKVEAKKKVSFAESFDRKRPLKEENDGRRSSSEECSRPFCKLKKRIHFHCNFCDQGFSSKQRLLAHVQKHLTTKLHQRNKKNR